MPTERERRFLTLVRENDFRLRRICRVYERDPEARKDLYQEILLQLWRSFPSFAGESSPDTWLYRVALNTALMQARRRSRRPESLLEAEVGAEEGVAPDRVDGALEDTERHERLYAAIDHLGDVEKMLITMSLDERSYREIAAVVGISENHVGVKLHRIRKALGAWLTEEKV